MEADCSSSSCPQKVFPGHEFLVAITRESLTLSFQKKLSSMSRSNNWTEKQAKKDCYTAECRQRCAPGHGHSVPIER